MKNIFLIGDSIRFGATEGNSPGYGVYVKEMLAGQANVYAPAENCRFAQYTQRYLKNWAQDIDCESIDVVHWNNGLWDVLHLDDEEAFTDIDIYVRVLRRVYRRIRTVFPNAKVIFALSTAVIEENAPEGMARFNHEIEQYNAAAAALMQELGVEINDLYSVTKAMAPEMYADWVHYGEEGSRTLAQIVAAKVMA